MSWSLVPRDCELSYANTLANRIQEYLQFKRKSITRSTYKSLSLCLEEFEIFVGRKELDRKLLLQWDTHISKPTHKLTTIVKKNNIVKAFLRWCEDQQFTDTPYYRFIPSHKLPAYPLPSIYTEDEYEHIKKVSFGTPNYYMTVLGYRTGMSMVDCCCLRWPNVNMETLMIRAARIKMVRHGESAVFLVPILANSDLHQMLEKLQGEHRIRFNNANDEFVNPDLAGLYLYEMKNVTDSYKKMLKEAGITGKTFKNWRNTFISNVANSGMNLGLACKLTAHKDPAIFASYIRPDEEALRSGVQAAFQWAAEKKMVKQLRKASNGQP